MSVLFVYMAYCFGTSPTLFTFVRVLYIVCVPVCCYITIMSSVYHFRLCAFFIEEFGGVIVVFYYVILSCEHCLLWLLTIFICQ